MASENYRASVDDYSIWQATLEKRLMHQERRPQVSSAQDLLGPGAGPYAIQINDWNADETVFNGTFWSEPGSLNAPTLTDAWMGETFGVDDGSGFQRATLYDPDAPTPDFMVYQRRFTSASGVRHYSSWVRVDPGAIERPQVGVASVEFLNQDRATVNVGFYPPGFSVVPVVQITPHSAAYNAATTAITQFSVNVTLRHIDGSNTNGNAHFGWVAWLPTGATP